MIHKVECYSITCDNCKDTLQDWNDFSIWADKGTAEDEVSYNDWHEEEGKHYCPNCFKIDDDDKIILIKDDA